MKCGAAKELLRARLPEICILALMVVLLWSNLSLFLTVDIWRNDSMYYVTSYDDKLVDEGRWINHLLFRFLQLVPSDIAILSSYICVLIFATSVAYRVTVNVYFSIVFGILCSLTPVLLVQLEWPETLLFGFVFLAFSPLLQSRFSDIYFFPLTAALFMGTFSAFYFLMPLLFLRDLNFARFWKLLLFWVGGFIFAYLFTNLLVYVLTGNFIQIAGWRNPNYIHSVDDLLENIERVGKAISIHLGKAQSFIKTGLLLALLLVAVFFAVRRKQYWLPLLAIVCSLGIYVSTVPVGIYIQDRTTLSAFIALFAALFLYPGMSRKVSILVMLVMFLLATRMAMVGHRGIDWYKTQVTVLKTQFESVIEYPPEEVNRVFIAAEMSESYKLFQMIERNTGKKNVYSEGFSHLQYWVPVLKSMGYKNFRVCADLAGWDCDQIKAVYQERLQYQQEKGLFISRRLPDGGVVLMINPGALK